MAFRSAPAQNVPPAPVSTATAWLASASKARKTSASSVAVGRSMALATSGRSMRHDRDGAVDLRRGRSRRARRPRSEELAGMAAVDVADERRVDVVPEQLLQARGSVRAMSGGTASTWFSTGRSHADA